MLDWVLNTPLYFNPLCLNSQISTDKTTTQAISKHLISDKVYNRVASLTQMAHIKGKRVDLGPEFQEFLQAYSAHLPILGHCSLFVPSENMRNPLA